jgi:MFS family permease
MFTQAYKRYVLFTLTALLTTHYTDRHILSIALQSIKADLKLSDTQLGFLTGIAFALFYATLGIPIARLADKGNRVTISSVAIALWGATVMSCGLVTNFIQLALARVGASVGEAGCMPPSYSLLGDYFSGPGNTRAMSAYIMGGVMSALLAFSVGGWLVDVYGWRTTFFFTGIPGLVLAVILKLTVTEPRGRPAYLNAVTERPSAKDVLVTMWRQKSNRYLVVAVSLFYMIGWGFPVWMPALLARNYHMGSSEIGIWVGMVIGVVGAAGITTGGYVFDRFLLNKEHIQAYVMAVVHLATIPLAALFALASNKYVSLAAMTAFVFIFNSTQGGVFALLQRLVKPNMRATALSLVMLLANLVGLGFGPQLIGILSDAWAGSYGARSLGMAMAAALLVLLPAAYFFVALARTVRKDLAAVEGQGPHSCLISKDVVSSGPNPMLGLED